MSPATARPADAESQQPSNQKYEADLHFNCGVSARKRQSHLTRERIWRW